MKRGIVAFFLLIFSFHAFYQAGVVVWFYANRAYIASVLCENKAKPELKCKGNCQLNKKAGNDREKNDQTVPSSISKWVEISPCEIASFEIAFDHNARLHDYGFMKPGFYAFQMHHGIFHPPTS